MNRKTLRTVLAITLLAGGSLSLSACNTTRGAGQDISAAGKATSNAATSAEKKINNWTSGK
nr:entericidin A/B family lipoprotein [uncultured Neokomagataea sp.]